MASSRAIDRIKGQALSFGDGADFCGRIMRGIGSGRVLRYTGEVLRQARILVVGSGIVLVGLAFALGLVVGIEGAYAARLVGAPSAAGAFAAIGNLREIAPYAFGYMMAAKVSTGLVAELGTMRISDEIDALDVMGFDSVLYLCSTRLLAAWLVIPFLYAIAVLVAFFASFLAVVVQVGEVSAGGYLELFWKFQSPPDYLFSMIKAFLMATFAVVVGCYFGYRASGGPAGVGQATARAMVVDLIGIHIIGVVTSQLFWGELPRLPIGG